MSMTSVTTPLLWPSPSRLHSCRRGGLCRPASAEPGSKIVSQHGLENSRRDGKSTSVENSFYLIVYTKYLNQIASGYEMIYIPPAPRFPFAMRCCDLSSVWRGDGEIVS